MPHEVVKTDRFSHPLRRKNILFFSVERAPQALKGLSSQRPAVFFHTHILLITRVLPDPKSHGLKKTKLPFPFLSPLLGSKSVHEFSLSTLFLGFEPLGLGQEPFF